MKRILTQLLFVIILCGASHRVMATRADLNGAQKGTLFAGEYIAQEQLHIAAGDTLFLSPGVTIYFKMYAGIAVKGTLLALGTPGQKIILTSYKELQPTALDFPKPADWNGIKIDKSSRSVIMSNVQIKYSTFGIESATTEPSIQLRDVSFFSNGLSNLTIATNTILPSDMLVGDLPVSLCHGENANTGTNIANVIKKYKNIAGIVAGTVEPGEYCINGTLTIPKGSTLTFKAPCVVRLTPHSSILVKGQIKTDGGFSGTDAHYAKKPGVVFTSYRDGTANDSARFGPGAGDWGGIRIAAGSDSSVLKSVRIDYSAYGLRLESGAMVYAEEIDFGSHNGLLKQDGLHDVTTLPVTFDQ